MDSPSHRSFAERRTLGYRSKQLLALIFVMLTFEGNCQSEVLQGALLSTVLLLVCKVCRPADFLHSGDLSALGMRYLPIDRGITVTAAMPFLKPGVQECGFTRLSGMQYLPTSNVVFRAEAGSSNLAASCVSGGAPGPSPPASSSACGASRHTPLAVAFEVPCKVVRVLSVVALNFRGTKTCLCGDAFSCSSKVARVEIATLSGLSAELHSLGC